MFAERNAFWLYRNKKTSCRRARAYRVKKKAYRDVVRKKKFLALERASIEQARFRRRSAKINGIDKENVFGALMRDLT